MKNVLLSLALLVSVPVLADIHIRSNVMHTIRESSTQISIQNSSFDFVLNDTDNRYVKLTDEAFEVTCTIISAMDKYVSYAIQLFVRNVEGELKLTTSQVFTLPWGKEAYVRFGRKNEKGEVLEDRLITFVAHRDIDGSGSKEITGQEAVAGFVSE